MCLCVFLIMQTLPYQCVYGIHACMVCLFSLDVLRQGRTQRFFFHMCTAYDTNKHANTRTHTHAHAHKPLALICCDRAVISALLTLWASSSLCFLHPTPLACDHRMVCINHRLQRHLFVCVCVCVCSFSMQVSLRGLVSESN